MRSASGVTQLLHGSVAYISPPSTTITPGNPILLHPPSRSSLAARCESWLQ
jgi:hypothetical protein